jgi:RHS repeat-associated protein
MNTISRALCLAISLVALVVGLPIHADDQGFAGEVSSVANNTIYLRSRCYDPETGSFVTKDPLGVHASINGYLYANGNPVNVIDPSGLDPAFSPIGIFSSLTAGQEAAAVNQPGPMLIAGLGIGVGGAAIVTLAAPVAVSGLIGLGLTPVAAGTTVDMGLLLTGGAGLASTAANTTAAVKQGNWNAVAFNAGTVLGGSIVGMSPFGGSMSGGRYMANTIAAC